MEKFERLDPDLDKRWSLSRVNKLGACVDFRAGPVCPPRPRIRLAATGLLQGRRLAAWHGPGPALPGVSSKPYRAAVTRVRTDDSTVPALFSL